MPENIQGERLASVETELRYIRETLQRVSVTMETLAINQIKIESIEIELKKAEDRHAALDSDHELVSKGLANLEKEMHDFRVWIKARLWVAVTLMTLAASLTGFLLHLFGPLVVERLFTP